MRNMADICWRDLKENGNHKDQLQRSITKINYKKAHITHYTNEH